jgi:GNAT superfamily N-acetyltransferase
VRIRPARHDDLAAVLAIAADGGSPDGDERYLDHVASHGRLLVADHHDRVVGFAGSIAVGDIAMVTDLFVDAGHRGQMVGTALLAAATAGWERRMTFSSTHPMALPLYERAGLVRRWDLLTLRGPAVGGGAPLEATAWRHDRRELVEYFRACGAVVGADHVVQPGPEPGPAWTVSRMISDRPEIDAAALLAGLPAGAPVEWSVPEHHPLAEWLLGRGFMVVDRDVFCSTDGVRLVPQLSSVHRGLL